MPEHEKKRIRPVIEEVVQDIPEEKPQKVKEEPVEEKDSSSVKNTTEKAKEVLNELDTLHRTSKKEPHKSNFKLIFGITILTALIVGFVAGGVYVYFSGVTSLRNKPEPTPTPSSGTIVATQTPDPTPTVSPTPSPKADLSLLKVSVLNGSGKIGEAGKAKTLIEAKGFKVSNVGNAANYTFTDTVIELKETVSDEVFELIETSLADAYSVKKGSALKANSQYDIVVTVGSK